MRILLHFCLVLSSLGLFFLHKTPNLHQPEAELEHKAQRLLDRYYGPGHAFVCVTCKFGHGQRTTRDLQLGEKGFVVQSQQKHETCQGKYLNDTQLEKVEIPRKNIVTHQDFWVESTDVAVVVDRDPGSEIVPLLEAGLGLRQSKGDQITVVRAQL